MTSSQTTRQAEVRSSAAVDSPPGDDVFFDPQNGWVMGWSVGLTIALPQVLP